MVKKVWSKPELEILSIQEVESVADLSVAFTTTFTSADVT